MTVHQMNNDNAGEKKGILTRTDNPFWWTILALLVPSALSGYQIYDQKTSQAQDRIEREAAVDLRSLQIEIAGLSVLIDSFAYPLITEHRLDDKNRDLVLQNVVKQHERVRQMEAFLPPEQRSVALQYRDDLLRVRDSIRLVRDTMDLGVMYHDLVALLRSQEKLLETLQARAGLLELATS
jgi:hypothetical protein